MNKKTLVFIYATDPNQKPQTSQSNPSTKNLSSKISGNQLPYVSEYSKACFYDRWQLSIDLVDYDPVDRIWDTASPQEKCLRKK